MTDTVGEPEAVKERLRTYVDSAIGGLASNNWKINVSKIGEYPASTIRMEYAFMHDSYGKKIPESGRWCIYDFTIFVHDEEDRTVENITTKHYKVMDDADDIVDYLVSKDGDSTEISDHNIINIYDINIEQANRGHRIRNLGRMIITGKIKTRWAS